MRGELPALFGNQQAQPPTKESPSSRRLHVDCLKRREASWLAVLQRQIGSARRPDVNLRATVLVDEELARPELFRLRLQKSLQDRLARAGQTENERVANVSNVEVEVVWRER